jgi:hypothetical protein
VEIWPALYAVEGSYHRAYRISQRLPRTPKQCLSSASTCITSVGTLCFGHRLTLLWAFKMRRLTARLLLVLLLAGLVTPAVLAISAPAPHACCRRKGAHQHPTQGVVLQSVSCGDHRCCSSAASVQWAEAATQSSSCVHLAEADHAFCPAGTSLSCRRKDSHDVRAPPLNE